MILWCARSVIVNYTCDTSRINSTSCFPAVGMDGQCDGVYAASGNQYYYNFTACLPTEDQAAGVQWKVSFGLLSFLLVSFL